MVHPTLVYLNQIWDTYPIEFILLICSSAYFLIRTINDFLPNKWKIDKRLYYLIKIQKVICSIKVSIPLRTHIDNVFLMKKLESFWSEETSTVRDNGGIISFNSNLTGSTYEISTYQDEEEEKTFLTINNFNGFSIGPIGGIKNLDSAINEIQKITEFFSAEKESTDKISVEIQITPRTKKWENHLSTDYKKENYSCCYNCKNIKITNEGYSSLKENISKVLYEWMGYYI